jgi:hypothetical protein
MWFIDWFCIMQSIRCPVRTGMMFSCVMASPSRRQMLLWMVTCFTRLFFSHLLLLTGPSDRRLGELPIRYLYDEKKPKQSNAKEHILRESDT